MHRGTNIFGRLPVARKLSLVVGVFVCVVIAVFYLGALRSDVLSGIRAYVGGEGLWSRAQKRAVFRLTRYAESRAESDYQDYLANISVPLGDRQARLQLEQPKPDMALVRRGFVQGRNHSDDVADMAMVFRRFRHVAYVERATAIWTEADTYIEQLQGLADQLHQEVSSGHPDPQKMGRIIDQVELVDARLTPLEDRFSFTLGEGARWFTGVLSVVTLAASILLLVGGVGFSALVLRQIRNSEEKYRNLVNTANDAILVIDKASRVILQANQKACELLGIPEPKLVGMGEVDLYPPPEKDQSRHLLAPSSSPASPRPELDLMQADGSLIPVEVSASAAELDGRQVIQGIFRDIRERRAMEERTRQAQKMEAVGQLAGYIAHDFNNLLAVVRGHAEIMLHRSAADPPLLQSANVILKTVDHATRLARGLLSLSATHVFSPQIVDLNSLAGEMEGLLRTLLGERIEFEMRLDPALMCLSADPGQIEQVILNLAVNARDAMPNGGNLVLESGNVEFHAASGGQVAMAGHCVMLLVRDTGVGMDAETQKHIFDPFFTTKGRGDGGGLGLSVVYQIVKDSGGQVFVSSEPGRGSTFKIFFPAVAARASSRQDEAAPATGVAETVLLADDQHELREMVGGFLRHRGYVVLEASNGAEAVQVASRHHGSIDVLLTDVVMPGMRGTELAKRLLAARPRMRVVYISGYTEGGLGDQADHSAGALLQKPFKLGDLENMLRDALGQH
jgi:two-component system cell cycle sensor histidine kinase/response regulator CckA